MTIVKSYGIKGVVAGLALMFGQAFPALISVTPAYQEVYVGSRLSVDIMISELDATEDLSTFDIDLAYNSSILQFSDYELSDALGSISLGDAIDASSSEIPGLVNIANISWLDDLGFQADAFKLATITFKGIDEGISDLSLNVKELGDFFGDPLAYTTENGSVSSVPEASTVMLLGSGALVLTLVSFRKRILQ